MDPMEKIREQVENNPVLIYMKGTPQMPMCGFSSRTVEALKRCGQEFGYVNVLADRDVMENLKRFSDWPTFPQVYINGELVGGCDITLELFEQGKLQEMIGEAVKGKA